MNSWHRKRTQLLSRKHSKVYFFLSVQLYFKVVIYFRITWKCDKNCWCMRVTGNFINFINYAMQRKWLRFCVIKHLINEICHVLHLKKCFHKKIIVEFYVFIFRNYKFVINFYNHFLLWRRNCETSLFIFFKEKLCLTLINVYERSLNKYIEYPLSDDKWMSIVRRNN